MKMLPQHLPKAGEGKNHRQCVSVCLPCVPSLFASSGLKAHNAITRYYIGQFLFTQVKLQTNDPNLKNHPQIKARLLLAGTTDRLSWRPLDLHA